MYEIEYTKDTEYIAKVVHSEKKIKLGVQFRTLDFITRSLILEHERAHEIDKCDELTADLRAVKKVAKQTKQDLLYVINHLAPYRSEMYLQELKEMLL